MTSLEGPVAGWVLTKLGPLGRRLAQQLRRDHRPILGRQSSSARDYDAFYLFAAVAPSNTPRQRSSLDFIDATHAFVNDGLSSMFTTKAEYSGGELVRFREPVDGPARPEELHHALSHRSDRASVCLQALPGTALRLSEIIEVISRLHGLVGSDAYLRLYRTRLLERRRVDWRIGVNSRAVPRNGGNMISWNELATPASLPSARIDDPHPICPPEGYGADRLLSVPPASRPATILQPVLEGLPVGGRVHQRSRDSPLRERAGWPGRLRQTRPYVGQVLADCRHRRSCRSGATSRLWQRL